MIKSKDDDKIISTVRDCYLNSVKRFSKHKENTDIISGVRKDNSLYKSTTIPKMLEILSTYISLSTTGNGSELYRVGDYNNIEAARQASAATKLINYYMYNMDIAEMSYQTAYEMLSQGTSILEVEYLTLYTQVVDEEKSGSVKLMFSKDGYKATKAKKYKRVPIFRQPNIRQINLNNFWVDDSCTSMKDLRVACISEFHYFKDIEKLKDVYDLRNLEEAKKSSIPCRGNDTYVRSTNNLNHHESNYLKAVNYNSTEAGKDNPKCELVKLYEEGTVQFILNDVVISDKIIIYEGVRFPFVVFRNEPKKGDFFGTSVVDLMKDDVMFHEELIKLIHDSYRLNLKPIFLTDVNSFSPKELEDYKNAKAGDYVSIAGFNSDIVREIKAEPPSPASFNFAAFFDQSAKDSVSVTPQMVGGQGLPSGVRTDSTFQALTQMSSTRIKNSIRMYTRGLENVGRIMLKVSKQYSDGKEYIAITGALGDTFEGWVDPTKLDPTINFKVRLSAEAEPERYNKMQRQFEWLRLAKEFDLAGSVRTEKALAESAALGDLFEDSVGMFEDDPQVIQDRATVQGVLAGVSDPISSNFISDRGKQIQIERENAQLQQDLGSQNQPQELEDQNQEQLQ